MKRSFVGAGLVVASLALGSSGCSQTGPKETTSKTKPGDPTSWADHEVANDSVVKSSNLPKTSRLSGGWSSESREIEESLGVGGR